MNLDVCSVFVARVNGQMMSGRMSGRMSGQMSGQTSHRKVRLTSGCAMG